MKFQSTITNEEINQLPLDRYNGKIDVITNETSLKKALKAINNYPFVGIDTETKPVFKKGQFNDVSLLQIAIPDRVFLIRINETGLTDGLVEFFENSAIKKIGVALADDIKDLQKLKQFRAKEFHEINKMVDAIGIESNGLKKLTATILGFRISKGAQVSNWEAEVLTEKQLWYAATDAWVCLEMYQKLLDLKLL